MKMLEEFPTITMFLSFFVASCTAAYFTLGMKIMLLFIFTVILISVIINPKLHGQKIIRQPLRTGIILVSGAVILSVLISIATFDIYADSFKKHSGEQDKVTLKITECDYTLSYTSRYKAKIISSEKLPEGTKVLLNTSLGYMEEGSVVSGSVVYTALEEYIDSFDARNYYNPKKIMIVCEDKSLAYERMERSFSFDLLFSKLNRKLSAMITAHTDSTAGGLASAVLLGNQSRVSDANIRDFRRLGISHLLVASGTHFAVIVTSCEAALKRLKITRRIRAGINISVIFIFMALTGFTPSVVRAGIMHLLAQLSIIVYSKANILNSFALSGTVLILFNPLCAIDCGLQLSFVATYSCIMIQQTHLTLPKSLKAKSADKKYLKKFISAIFGTIITTCFITLNTLPLTWLYFGEISLLSLFSNIIFIPLVTLLMYLSAAYLLLYPMRIFIYPMSAAINGLCSVITSAADFFAKFDGIMLPINYSFSIFFLLPLTVILIAIPLSKPKNRIKLAASALSVCVCFTVVITAVRIFDSNNTYITYIGKGKNDGFVLKSDNKAMLCEISDASFGFSYNLTEEMSELHCCAIDSLLITHYHSKHVQLFGRLCEREILKNLILTTPINEKEESVYNSLIKAAQKNNINITEYGENEKIRFGNAEITLFERKYLSRSTHPITSLMISSENENTVIASCSFNESSEYITKAIENSENVILGRHSPVYKKTFGLSFKNKPKVLAACTDAYEHMDDETRSYFNNSGAFIDSEIIRIKIPSN